MTTYTVELLSFTAQPNESSVLLNWITASEKNNDYFSVEKSKDGVEFTEVAKVKGAGNSTTKLTYTELDSNPHSGTSYYRLKQTDFDGKYSYSTLLKVDFNNSSESSQIVYPNPNEGEIINIDFVTAEDQQIVIDMYDLSGNIIYSLAVMADKGNNKHTIYMSNKLGKGTYIITTSTIRCTRLHNTKFTVD